MSEQINKTVHRVGGGVVCPGCGHPSHSLNPTERPQAKYDACFYEYILNSVHGTISAVCGLARVSHPRLAVEMSPIPAHLFTEAPAVAERCDNASATTTPPASSDGEASGDCTHWVNYHQHCNGTPRAAQQPSVPGLSESVGMAIGEMTGGMCSVFERLIEKAVGDDMYFESHDVGDGGYVKPEAEALMDEFVEAMMPGFKAIQAALNLVPGGECDREHIELLDGHGTPCVNFKESFKTSPDMGFCDNSTNWHGGYHGRSEAKS